MQSTPTPTRWRWWLQWGLVLVLGIILGFLQISLYNHAQALEEWSGSGLTTLALGALFYVLFPLLAGFLISRQSEGHSAGMGAGCLAGGIAFLIAAISLILILASFPTTCTGGTDGAALGCGGLLNLGRQIIFTTLLMEGFGGFVGGLMGGGIGSIMGK